MSGLQKILTTDLCCIFRPATRRYPG